MSLKYLGVRESSRVPLWHSWLLVLYLVDTDKGPGLFNKNHLFILILGQYQSTGIRAPNILGLAQDFIQKGGNKWRSCIIMGKQFSGHQKQSQILLFNGNDVCLWLVDHNGEALRHHEDPKQRSWQLL